MPKQGKVRLLDGRTKYSPLADVRETLHVRWYRCPVEITRFRELMERSDIHGFCQALGHLGLACATGTAAFYLWSRRCWLAMTAALWVHGTIASCFTFATHELGHGTVFRTKWLNRFFLNVFGILNWREHINYSLSHTYHHRYTQYPEADRENLAPLVPSLHPWLMLQLFTVNVFTRTGRTFGTGGLLSTIRIVGKAACGLAPGSTDVPAFEWIAALHADQPAEARRMVRWSRAVLLFHGSVFVLSMASGLWVLPLIVSFSAFTGNWLKYFLGQTQHCGLRGDVPDFRKNTRSMTLDPFCEFLYWRMNWHTEHHMFAGMPCYRLKSLHKEVAHDMPVPRTLVGAWREMREIWRRQQLDASYEFDTPLPETAGRGDEVRIGLASALESSIGDLAPKGL